MIDEYIRRATVTNVVDGDTLDMVVELGYNVKIEHRFRLLGVDTPEPHQEGGRLATRFVENEVLGKTVYVKSHKSDSFGRYLGDVYVPKGEREGYNLGQELIRRGLAEPYLK